MPQHLDILCWLHVGREGRTNGHAAILLESSVESHDANVNAAATTYISWWPDGGALKGLNTPWSRRPGRASTLVSDMQSEINPNAQRGLHEGRFEPRRGQTNIIFDHLDLSSGPLSVLDHASQEEHEHFMESLMTEGGISKQWVQFPTESISLHTEGNAELGLNAHAMLTWWRAFRSAHEAELQGKSGYQFISKLYNCASIVMRTLIAGEAAFFLKPPNALSYYSPRDVADYAKALKHEIILANCSFQRYFVSKQEWQRQNRREMHRHPPTATTDLPTVGEWRQMSDENIKWRAFARRRGQTAEIDRLLGRYHAAPAWDADGGQMIRLGVMSVMFEQIGSYIAAKPKGDRLNAMLALGQIILVVRVAKANADMNFFN